MLLLFVAHTRARWLRLSPWNHLAITRLVWSQALTKAAIREVESKAKARRVQVVEAAAARSALMKANVTRSIYHELVREMGFGGRDLLLLQYVESMRASLATRAEQGGGEIYMDITTPGLFKDPVTKALQV
jgi:hypothetical protein